MTKNELTIRGDIHKAGSMDCKAGICNVNGGWWNDMVPMECPYCDGIIHGYGDYASLEDMEPDGEEFVCDKCNTEFGGDDLCTLKSLRHIFKIMEGKLYGKMHLGWCCGGGNDIVKAEFQAVIEEIFSDAYLKKSGWWFLRVEKKISDVEE